MRDAVQVAVGRVVGELGLDEAVPSVDVDEDNGGHVRSFLIARVAVLERKRRLLGKTGSRDHGRLTRRK